MTGHLSTKTLLAVVGLPIVALGIFAFALSASTTVRVVRDVDKSSVVNPPLPSPNRFFRIPPPCHVGFAKPIQINDAISATNPVKIREGKGIVISVFLTPLDQNAHCNPKVSATVNLQASDMRPAPTSYPAIQFQKYKQVREISWSLAPQRLGEHPLISTAFTNDRLEPGSPYMGEIATAKRTVIVENAFGLAPPITSFVSLLITFSGGIFTLPKLIELIQQVVGSKRKKELVQANEESKLDESNAWPETKSISSLKHVLNDISQTNQKILFKIGESKRGQYLPWLERDFGLSRRDIQARAADLEELQLIESRELTDTLYRIHSDVVEILQLNNKSSLGELIV